MSETAAAGHVWLVQSCIVTLLSATRVISTARFQVVKWEDVPNISCKMKWQFLKCHMCK
jgi:hypothetical protein